MTAMSDQPRSAAYTQAACWCENRWCENRWCENPFSHPPSRWCENPFSHPDLRSRRAGIPAPPKTDSRRLRKHSLIRNPQSPIHDLTLPFRAILLILASLAAGCARPPGPIFPDIDPPIVWPPPPDQPRIRYVGELRGEANLGLKPQGWEAVQEVLTGPHGQVEFSRPSAVAVADDRVFVADTGLGVVHRLDLAARQYRLLRGSPTDPLRVPIDLAVADDRLLVVDRARAAVEVFDLDGAWRATHRWPELAAPVAVAWDAARRVIWFADAAAHACFGTNDMQTLSRHIGEPGSAPGQFNFPTALAWHPTVGLAVADAMNFRVQVFDDAGHPLRAFGKKGDAAGDFSRPRGVALDSLGHLYVLDNQFENVQIFDGEGRLLMAFGGEGDRPGQFSLPSGVTIDDRDRIWIADSSNHRVQVFQYLPEKTPCAE